MEKWLQYYLVIVYLAISTVHCNSKITSCAQTPYPQVCHHFMGPKTISPSSSNQQTTQNFITFRNLALQTATNNAIRAHDLVSSIDLTPYDDRARLAWSDCQELYDDTVNKLNTTFIKITKNKNKNYTPIDTQTWLSAAIANQQTCRNGFDDFSKSSIFLSYRFDFFTNVTKLISNSLAINKDTPASSRSSKIGGRRSLFSDDDELPFWVSSSDRRLLQTSRERKVGDVVVALDGSGDYETISDAVTASVEIRRSRSMSKRFVIYVKAGVYHEHVEIMKSVKNLMIIGDGIDITVVTGNKNVKDGSTTFHSATFAVSGERFMACDITFENTAGPQKHQAVALRSNADLSVFHRCSFKGYQDTLYVHSQRQFYGECDVYGTVDFIFGDAIAILQNCNIYARKPLIDQKNTITAQGRKDPNENTGIVIHNSRVVAANDLRPNVGSYKTYLGRPWHEYSRTIFMKSEMDGSVDPSGWFPWNGSFGLSTLYYGEYMNSGIGSSTSGRVKWEGLHLSMTSMDAQNFTVDKFLGGYSWISAVGVPFESGL